jgi:predicted DNA binding CopG/RHH family protein
MEEKKQRQTTFRLNETDHMNMKILAAKERKTIQELILTALDKAFPGWREEHKK